MAGHTGEGYWKEREAFRYYEVVRGMLDGLSPARTLLDVGSGSTPVATWGQFETRVALDLKTPKSPAAGVHYVRGNFLTYPAGEHEVVTCLQVLEHLADGEVEVFARRLLATGRCLIVSVPHRWPKGRCAYHPQDPVDLEKVQGWFGRPAVEHVIVEDRGLGRLVCRFNGDANPAAPRAFTPGPT